MNYEPTLLELNQRDVEGFYYSDKGMGHCYLSIYEELFAPYRHKNINLFEVGYLHGGSATLWEKYFSKANIRMIDISSCVPPPTGRTILELQNIWDIDTDYFKDFPIDIAIDDGSHLLEDQIRFVKIVYPALREGGVMIVEDIQNIDKQKIVFELLDIPFSVIDLRDKAGRYDDVLLIYRKGYE
jgi:hypothetical protein